MTKKLKVAIVGTIIAVIVGIAASNGLITQQTADDIKDQTDAILSEDGDQEPAPDATAAPPADPAPQESEAPATEPTPSPEPAQEPAPSPEPEASAVPDSTTADEPEQTQPATE